jgi:DNA-binding NarL/FixJ family response regulator
VSFSMESNDRRLAEPRPRRLDQHDAQRAQAIALDAVSIHKVALAGIWRGLLQGELRVVDSFFTRDRCGIVTARNVEAPGLPLSSRRAAVLESLLCGVGQKCIAIELQLAASTVAVAAKAAFEQLGGYGRPSRAHPVLMLAATASRLPDVRVTASETLLLSETSERRVVGMRRPELSLVGTLPRAELEVITQLVEGRCHEQIAEARGTSTRTTANQIATIFRRLGVSGRGELMQRLFLLSGALSSRGAADGTLPASPSASAAGRAASRQSGVRLVRAHYPALGRAV